MGRESEREGQEVYLRKENEGKWKKKQRVTETLHSYNTGKLTMKSLKELKSDAAGRDIFLLIPHILLLC